MQNIFTHLFQIDVQHNTGNGKESNLLGGGRRGGGGKNDVFDEKSHISGSFEKSVYAINTPLVGYQRILVLKCIIRENECQINQLHHPLPLPSLGASIEPQHDKTNKVSVRPAKTQISLGIRPV